MKWILVAILGSVAALALIGAIAGAAAGVVTIDSVQRVVGKDVVSRGIVSGARASVGLTRAEDLAVGIGTARAVQVTLKIAAGDLHVSGGTDALMSGRFAYNVAEWQPAVSYAVSAERGQLTVQQPATNDIVRGADGARNRWSVRLNTHVPMTLRVDEGAGTSDLTLGGLTLAGLTVNVGAGETRIDLGGAWTHGFDAAIRGGVGDLTVRLPSQVGVRVSVDTGLFHNLDSGGLRRDGSAYVNSAYGISPVTMNVAIQQGLGSIKLETGPSGS